MTSMESIWRLTSLGLRLKIAAVIWVSLLLFVAAVLLVVSPKTFVNPGVQWGIMAAFGLFVATDFFGRICCLFAPVSSAGKFSVQFSIASQTAALIFLVTPFLIDRELDLTFRWLVALAPAICLQIAAAVVFMQFARELAMTVQRPDLAVLPNRVLLWFGLGGTSLVVFALVLCLIILVLLCLSCGLLAYSGILIAKYAHPLVLLPIFGFIAVCIAIPFQHYITLHHRLAKAIDQWRYETMNKKSA